MKWVCESVEEYDAIAVKLLPLIIKEKKFALYGDMGVGKTTLVKSICRALSSDDVVSSPTFSIVNHYISNQNKNIYHFDFYRIENVDEVFDLGYETYFFDANSYCFVEWPQKIQSLMPENFIKIFMQLDGNKRIIKIKAYD